MGANYSFELISIETYAPQFFGLNNLFLGGVPYSQALAKKNKSSLKKNTYSHKFSLNWIIKFMSKEYNIRTGKKFFLFIVFIGVPMLWVGPK